MYGIDGLVEALPEPLLDAAASARLRAVGGSMPDALSGTLFLELRLGHDPRVDLGCLVRSTRQLQILAGTDPTIRLPRPAAAGDSWHSAMRLAGRSLRLIREKSKLSPWIWLELDLSGTRPPALGMYGIVVPTSGQHTVSNADRLEAVADILTTIGTPHTVEGPALRVAGRLADHGLDVCQVGSFPERPGAPVRLICMADPELPPGATAEALTRSGWPGPAPKLTDLIRRYGKWGQMVYLHLDVVDGALSSQVGLDVPFIAVPGAEAAGRRSGMLAELEASGLCAEAKRAAVENVDGTFTVPLFARRRCHVETLSIKVVLGQDATSTAKAYVVTYH